MPLPEKLKTEVRELSMASLYFFVWLGLLVALKKLILEEYRIEFSGMSAAVVGALVLAKVVLILEHVHLGRSSDRPAWLEILLRTALYSAGVLVVLLMEKAFESRHEHGGFWESLTSITERVDVHHVWANVICVAGALLGYNLLSVIRRHLGNGGLLRLLTSPLPDGPSSSPPSRSA